MSFFHLRGKRFCPWIVTRIVPFWICEVSGESIYLDHGYRSKWPSLGAIKKREPNSPRDLLSWHLIKILWLIALQSLKNLITIPANHLAETTVFESVCWLNDRLSLTTSRFYCRPLLPNHECQRAVYSSNSNWRSSLYWKAFEETRKYCNCCLSCSVKIISRGH